MGGAVFGGANKGCVIIKYSIVGCTIVDGVIVGRAGLHCQPRQHHRQYQCLGQRDVTPPDLRVVTEFNIV